MEKVWQSMHRTSRFCADSSTVSEKKVCLREPLCFSWPLVEVFGLNRDATKPYCRTTRTARVVIPRKSKHNTSDPDLVDLVAKTDWILPEALAGLTKPELRSFFLRGLTPRSWLVEEPYEGPEVFLVADAIHDGFHFGPGTYFTDGSKLYPDPRRREVGWGFCSVAADLQWRTGAYGPVTHDNATVPVAELLAVIFLVERSVGPIHIHSDCMYVCSGKNNIARRTERGAHVTLWSRLQQAFSRHQGDVEISWCTAHITPDKFHQFNSTDGLFHSASMPPVYLLLRLLHEVSLLTLRVFCLQRDASENVSAPSWKMLPRTHLSRLAKGITAVCVRTLHQLVVRWIGCAAPFAQGRPTLIRSIQCASGTRCYMRRTV